MKYHKIKPWSTQIFSSLCRTTCLNWLLSSLFVNCSLVCIVPKTINNWGNSRNSAACLISWWQKSHWNRNKCHFLIFPILYSDKKETKAHHLFHSISYTLNRFLSVIFFNAKIFPLIDYKIKFNVNSIFQKVKKKP